MKSLFSMKNAEHTKWQNKFRSLVVSQFSWLLLVVAVLIFDFIIIKSIVQGFDQDTVYYSDIKNAFQKEPSKKPKTDNTIQNALVKEIVAVSDTGIKIKKIQENKPADKAEFITISELRNFLQVKSNKFHVSRSGGINDLELTVYNQSPYFIDAVTVQVDYLQTKRKLVQTKSYTTTYVKPNSSKIIHIPSNKKGKKIKYRVTNVQSTECKLRKYEI